jgi:hypothetical protein
LGLVDQSRHPIESRWGIIDLNRSCDQQFRGDGIKIEQGHVLQIVEGVHGITPFVS